MPSRLAMSRRLLFGLAAAVQALATPPPAGADAGFPFRPVGASSGLAVDVVTAVYQDRAGFVWIGSRKGLFLYDGYSFKTFEHDVSDPTSLGDNDLRTIFEDSEGTLWIGTNTGGLDRLDRSSWTFTHYRHDSSDPRSLSHDSVYVIQEDRAGGLWVGTQVGLNRLDRSTGTFERFVADPENPDALPNDYIMALSEDTDGALWIATLGGGLCRRDGETGRFSTLRHDPDDPSSIASDVVHSLAAAPGGDLWVGTSVGVQLLERETGRFRLLGDATSPSSELAASLVTRIAVDGRLRPWIATWGGGVTHFDPGSRTFETYRQDLGIDDGPNDRVIAVMPDRDGAVWIGTWGGGVRRMRGGPELFEAITQEAGEEGLSYRDVLSVMEDSRGRLWAGTFGAGLNRRDPGERTFRVYADPPGSRTAYGIVEDAGGAVWWGAMTGLFRLDPASNLVTEWIHDEGEPEGIGPGYVTSLLIDRDGRLWVGTGEGGLHRMRVDGKTFDRFVHDPRDPRSLSDDYVTKIYEDSGGRLWIGTRSGGLNVLNGGLGTFRRYGPDPRDATSISHHFISSIHEDSGGTMWIGTSGGGLNRAVPGADGLPVAFERITERDGLVDDNVTAIAEDDDGSLWLATRRGLSRYDPVGQRFVSYDETDGIPSADFNLASASGAERIYLGSTGGVVSIRRGTPFPAPQPSPTLLTSVRTLDREVTGERPIWELDRLSVDYGEVLTLEFAVLDFDDPRRHRFAYRLAAGREPWIELGETRKITFTDLEPGSHAFQVRGRNRHGVWSAAPTVLQIEVIPPFWMTWWFRGLLVAGLLLAVVAGHRVRTAALRRHNRELIELKAQRERALGDAQASREALQSAYDRLRDLTRRLEAAKEDERARIARELHDEMGQGLTAAKINLQLLAGVPDEAVRERRILDTIGLVDRMIGHVRELSLDLRPPLLDELGLVAALRGFLEAHARRARLDIELETDGSPSGLPPEIEITAFRVVQEAVTNVIRHAEASRVDVSLRATDDGLEVAVRDDGGGFDVDGALASASEGRHLGLLGIRERVESIGGRVDIASRPGSGTEIAARIPLRDERRRLARAAGG